MTTGLVLQYVVIAVAVVLSAWAVLAAQAMGADLAYIGSPFIATEEANAVPDYKRMIVESGAMDIVTSSLFTGVSGNYLAPSIRAASKISPGIVRMKLRSTNVQNPIWNAPWKIISAQ